MGRRSLVPRLGDLVQACERIRNLLRSVPLDAFETDWQQQWIVERGIEIISEASRHLTDDLKARHANIPWAKVAGIGNILRHDCERVAPDILWKLVQSDLAELEQVCRSELAVALEKEDASGEGMS